MGFAWLIQIVLICIRIRFYSNELFEGFRIGLPLSMLKLYCSLSSCYLTGFPFFSLVLVIYVCCEEVCYLRWGLTFPRQTLHFRNCYLIQCTANCWFQCFCWILHYLCPSSCLDLKQKLKKYKLTQAGKSCNTLFSVYVIFLYNIYTVQQAATTWHL